MNFTLLNIYLLQAKVSKAPENKTGGIREKNDIIEQFPN